MNIENDNPLGDKQTSNGNQPPKFILPKKKNTFKDSITLKLIIVTVMTLLLLIPINMIKSIIKEREHLNIEAVNEVSAKWANRQKVNGPVLVVPVSYKEVIDEKLRITRRNVHLLPNRLKIDGEVLPEKLHRGIYEIVVYKSDLAISGDFDLSQMIEIGAEHEIHYDKAFLTVGISDLRGIKNEIKMKWGGQNIKVQPSSKIKYLIPNGVTFNLPELNDSTQKIIDFNFDLSLQGSNNMSFTPIGAVTEVSITSPWDSPSFKGNFLPDSREVTKDGFIANWKVLQMNKSFQQSWAGNAQRSEINAAAFGFDLILPLDDYQKSIRSVKYAIMTIVLTFLIFFLIEVVSKQKIHPFQYALVGLALCLFYILLASITEHVNFNKAYGVSTLGIVSIISLYSLSIFKVKRMTLLLIATLMGIYTFLFVTLQLADYALLMGSIGLVLILAATMYFTRNINWYQITSEDN